MRSLADLCAETLAGDPDRPAIEYDGTWRDWGSVQRLARQVRELLAASGAGERATVAFVPRNRPSALAALIGMLADGRSVVMVYAFQSPAAIAAALGRLDAAVAMLAEEDVTPEVLATLRAGDIACIALSNADARLVPGLERGRPRPDAGPPRVEILTSGTTGPPKRFPIPHAVITRFVLNQGVTMIDDAGAPPFLLSFPIGNISGIYSVAASLLRGRRVVLVDRFTVAAWHDYIRRYRPSASGAPPAAVAMIIDADLPREDLASLHYFSTGAAPLDPVVQRRFEDKYGIPVLLSYGATEFGGPVVAMTPELHAQWGRAKFGSVGRPMPGVALRVRDPETGAILGPGEEGLLELVSPRMGPEWITTTDIAVVDADGFLFHRGRADGAIARGGFKILPETIERVLLEHAGIAAAGVVGIPDDRVTEVPAAVIEVRVGAPPPTAAELDALIRLHLPATHVPAAWRFVDSLPKNPSFKVDRPAMKRLFAPGADRAAGPA